MVTLLTGDSHAANRPGSETKHYSKEAGILNRSNTSLSNMSESIKSENDLSASLSTQSLNHFADRVSETEVLSAICRNSQDLPTF
jgi:hypothetical protein